MITLAAAKKLEEMQIEKIQVRSPMTCEASLGVCRSCYGMDLATGQLVEVGMAVGIIRRSRSASPVRSSRCARSTSAVSPPAASRKKTSSEAQGQGQVRRLEHRDQRRRQEDRAVATVKSRSSMPRGASSRSTTFPTVPSCWSRTVRWSRGPDALRVGPYNIPILAEVGGKVRFDDIVEGETMKRDRPFRPPRRTIIETRAICTRR